MSDFKWYYWLAFILGGLAVLVIVYFILQSTGTIPKIASRRSKAAEIEQ